MFNLLACIPYLVTAIVALRAARTPARATDSERRDDRRAARFWLLVAAFFALLVAARLIQVEDMVRTAAREQLLAEHAYAGRRKAQVLLVAVMFAALGAGASFAARLRRRTRGRPGPRAMWWAGLGVVGMAALMAMRLVSLHALDALLFGGPHLNWYIDPALAALVCFWAWRYPRARTQAQA